MKTRSAAIAQNSQIDFRSCRIANREAAFIGAVSFQRRRRCFTSNQPGAPPQEFGRPGKQALKARFTPGSDFSIPHITLLEINSRSEERRVGKECRYRESTYA